MKPTLFARYEQLEPVARCLCELLAAAQDELPLGTLAACAGELGVVVGAGRQPARLLLAPLATLEAQGLVSAQARWVLEPGLSEGVARALIHQERFEDLAALVARHEPLAPSARSRRKLRAGTLQRELRRALCAGQGERLLGLLDRWGELGDRLGPAPSLAAWLDTPLEPQLLRRLPADLSGPLLEELSQARAERMGAELPLLPLVRELWEASPGQPELRAALGREALLAGEIQLAAAALADLHTVEGLALDAMLRLIQGDLAAAVRGYARATNARGKRDGRGATHLQGVEGALQPLAYLLHPSASRRRQGRRLLATAPVGGPRSLLAGHRHLARLDALLQGEPLPFAGAVEHPLGVLLASLVAWWAEEPLDSGLLERARARAAACGHGWLASELEALFAADAARTVPGAQALLQLLERGRGPAWSEPPVRAGPSPSAEGGPLQRAWEILRPADVVGSVHEQPTDSFPVLRLFPSGSGLVAQIRVRPFGASGPALAPGQGEPRLVVRAGDRLLGVQRDLAAERRAARSLEDTLPSLAAAPWRGGARWLEGVEQALELLLELRRNGGIVRVEWPEGEPLRLRAVLGPESLFMSVRGRGDWFAACGELRVDNQLVLALHDLLEQLERAPRRFVRLEDGSYLALTHALQRQLERLGRLAVIDPTGELRVHRLAAGALAPALDQAGGVDVDQAWRAQLDALGSTQQREQPVPRGLQAELRPYQREGFAWLARLAELGAGACLADDMGLGKTVQVLALLLQRAWLGPALVVAPTSVCGGWCEQAARFAPDLRVHRFGPGDREDMLHRLGPSDMVVCSYGLLQAEREALCGLAWTTAVLDEAQAIKNPDTQRHRAACALRAEQRVITTGTPIENHLGDLWALFQFLQPGLLGSAEIFRVRFAEPIQADRREVRDQLRQLVLPYILRRSKAAVLRELPPRTEVRITVELFPQELALYTAMRERAEVWLEQLEEPQPLQVLAQLTRLRMACCNGRLVVEPSSAPESAKLAAFAELVEQLREGGHRALVFSQFVRHLAILRAWLDERGVRYQYLDGSTPAAQRDRAVQAFQAGEGELFLISLRAGGFGLNLTAAQTVIHMDPWWNPAVEDQASDRAHRIGQQQPVTVYRLVARGTVEEKILALHEHKRQLADGLLEGSDAAGRMSVRDLSELIRGF